MDPLFKITSLSPGAGPSQDGSSDEASDERTSFIRSAKVQRKYGTTTSSNSRMSGSAGTSPLQYRQPVLLAQTAFIHHQVQPGDTLMGIALRYHTTVEYIKRINKMWTNDALFLKETLLVPSQESPQDRITRLVMEDEVNRTSSPTLQATCTQHLPESLNAISLHTKSTISRTASANGDESKAADSETSIHEYLGAIDSQIEEARNKVEALQKTSGVLKDHPEMKVHHSWSKAHQPQSSASSRLRLSLTDLGAEFNAATNSPDLLPSTAVVGVGSTRNKSKSLFNQKGTSKEEIFEL